MSASATLEKRISRFGVGPRIILSAIIYAALAGRATHIWPDACLLRAIPYRVLLIPGLLLLLLGIPMWLCAVLSVMRAYNRDQLVTSGVFGICRHPVYAAWIVLILPGLTLLTKSWPLMITPLVAYLVFKLLIGKEDDYLRQRFGNAYLEYRAKVNELIPTPRL
jgi:protein-S-isoprenylcysteine O-methyltransferase Ste14